MSDGQKRKTGKGARMRDVAERAGVSRMTVSRVMNQHAKVAPDLKERVDRAVRELGYVHNHLARSLSSTGSNVIGLILPSIDNSIFSLTVKGISDVLGAEGFQLMIAEAGYDKQDEERTIAAFLAQRVGGLVVHNTDHTAQASIMLAKAGIPVVENGDLTAAPVDMVVSYSNFEAARAMTLHLGRLGYRRIAFAGLDLHRNERARERQRGFLAAIEELGHAVDMKRVLDVPRGLAGGAEAVQRIDHSAPDTDALFCGGDVLAIGALFECQRRGWAVPERLAIASFDDVELLRHVLPPITSLQLPRYEIGKRSAKMILDRIAGRTMGGQVPIDLKFEIVQRAST